MIRRWFMSILCVILLLAPGSLTAASAAEPPATLRVLTRNPYLGADLAPFLVATTPQVLVGAVTTVYANVQAMKIRVVIGLHPSGSRTVPWHDKPQVRVNHDASGSRGRRCTSWENPP
ncbi:hypothetical protein [Streptomyces sp. NPDC048603]|uniref:hypothetical protein n=1 Tax=Streptomyces sp. NPDC048603 TaxID=3365577 RepID=UPI00371200C0